MPSWNTDLNLRTTGADTTGCDVTVVLLDDFGNVLTLRKRPNIAVFAGLKEALRIILPSMSNHVI
jgi:S-adenosylmethionine hydrolase